MLPLQFLAAGDFNGDGRADLISQTTGGSANVEVRLALPAGGFATPVLSPVGVLGQGRVAVRDLNGDGIPDLFTETFGNPVIRGIWFGSADGTFAFGLPISLSFGATVLADLNLDGRLDLVGFVAAPGGGSTGELRGLVNRGGGEFASQLLANLASSGVPLVGHLNADAIPDVLVLGGSPLTAQPLIQNAPSQPGDIGPMTVAPATTLISAAAGSQPSLLDVNGDGAPDIVFPGSTAFLVAYLRQGTIGSTPVFSAPTLVDPFPEFVTLPQLNRLTIADLNGDGAPEILRHYLVSGETQTTIGIKFGVPAAISGEVPVSPNALSFAPEFTLTGVPFRAGSYDAGPRVVPLVADIDGDGRTEALFDVPGNAAVPAPLAILHQYLPTGLVIDSPPVPARLRPGSSATFSVAAHAEPAGTALAYRWFKDGSPIAEGAGGGRYTGVATSTLAIADTVPSDSGTYRVQISTACQTLEGYAYLECSPLCVDAEFNRDGDLNADDLADYINAFFGGCD